MQNACGNQGQNSQRKRVLTVERFVVLVRFQSHCPRFGTGRKHSVREKVLQKTCLDIQKLMKYINIRFQLTICRQTDCPVEQLDLWFDARQFPLFHILRHLRHFVGVFWSSLALLFALMEIDQSKKKKKHEVLVNDATARFGTSANTPCCFVCHIVKAPFLSFVSDCVRGHIRAKSRARWKC